MRIIAHRGNNNKGIPGNTMEAFAHCLRNGYGVETDFRDHLGDVVISHNIASAGAMKAEKFFSYAANFSFCTLALNIKTDGIGEMLLKLLKIHKIENYFVFDMSIPQMLEYREKGIRFFTRQSEYEKIPVLCEDASGIWMDAFQEDEWITKATVQEYLNLGKDVCIVSSELHQRDEKHLWEKVKSWNIRSDQLLICTDQPEKAKSYFEVER